MVGRSISPICDGRSGGVVLVNAFLVRHARDYQLRHHRQVSRCSPPCSSGSHALTSAACTSSRRTDGVSAPRTPSLGSARSRLRTTAASFSSPHNLDAKQVHTTNPSTCLRYTAARARPWRCACATLSRPHASAMAAKILRRVLTTAAHARAVASRATETIMGGKGSGSKANKGKGKAQAVMTPVRAVHGCRVPPAVCSMRRASVDCCSNNEFE